MAESIVIALARNFICTNYIRRRQSIYLERHKRDSLLQQPVSSTSHIQSQNNVGYENRKEFDFGCIPWSTNFISLGFKRSE